MLFFSADFFLARFFGFLAYIKCKVVYAYAITYEQWKKSFPSLPVLIEKLNLNSVAPEAQLIYVRTERKKIAKMLTKKWNNARVLFVYCRLRSCCRQVYSFFPLPFTSLFSLWFRLLCRRCCLVLLSIKWHIHELICCVRMNIFDFPLFTFLLCVRLVWRFFFVYFVCFGALLSCYLTWYYNIILIVSPYILTHLHKCTNWQRLTHTPDSIRVFFPVFYYFTRKIR